jgi:hypothetical protein
VLPPRVDPADRRTDPSNRWRLSCCAGSCFALQQELARYLTLVGSERDQDVRRMLISTQGTGARQIFVSYISEVPIWKTSYRLVLPAQSDRKPLLQRWAVVDNTVGEDWDRVQLSLVAGSPQSFIQQISQPYYV